MCLKDLVVEALNLREFARRLTRALRELHLRLEDWLEKLVEKEQDLRKASPWMLTEMVTDRIIEFFMTCEARHLGVVFVQQSE